MKKHYVTEIFYSVQGEGRHVGAPSVFVRLFGCNLQCQGFGMPEGQLSNERESAYNLIQTTDVTHLEQLPLVKTGCDSYAAWDKRFRHLSEHLTADEIIQRIVDITPNKSLKGIHVVFTGGEPMLKQKLISEVTLGLYSFYGLSDITIETNGTKGPDVSIFHNLGNYVHTTFSVSQKLACSGEPEALRINKQALDIIFNDFRMRPEKYTCVYKFVVAGEDDIEEGLSIVDAVTEMDKSWVNLPAPKVYLMPVGGTKYEYQANSKAIADLALAYGLHYTPRLHIDIYGNAWAT